MQINVDTLIDILNTVKRDVGGDAPVVFFDEDCVEAYNDEPNDEEVSTQIVDVYVKSGRKSYLNNNPHSEDKVYFRLR